MTRIDGYASEVQFAEHVVAVLLALPPESRGDMMVANEKTAELVRTHGLEPRLGAVAGERPALVSAIGDLRMLRQFGRSRIALLEHGAGQSYAGRGENTMAARNPSYAGGDRRDADLFLHPNEHSAARDRAKYPDIPNIVVGSPALDRLPRRKRGPGPVVAITFHADMTIAPEAKSAFTWIRPQLAELAERYTVIGHAHPRFIDRLASTYEHLGIELVRDLADVCRRADLLIGDNTTAIPAFAAATGNPVLLLNPPWYDPDVPHGLRFWDAAPMGVNVDRPGDLLAAVERALEDPPAQREAREAGVRLFYAYRRGAAKRAAKALRRWAEDRSLPVRKVEPRLSSISRGTPRPRPMADVGRITVAMPYRGCPDEVGKAVDSVLAQTYRDIALVIIGDGERPPIETTDPRVTIHVLAEHRGTYFAHAVMLAAATTRWYSPHDADDWSEPDHLERLAEAELRRRTGAVYSRSLFRTTDGPERQVRTECWIGLYARSRLFEVGGFDPTARVAQDSLVLALLRRTGRVDAVERATYHHPRRPGSLTTDPATALRSEYRELVKAGHVELLAETVDMPAGEVAVYRRARVPATVWADVDREAAALTRKLVREAA